MCSTRRTTDGMALLTALLFIAVALILLGALSLRLVNQGRQVTHYLHYKECMGPLEAAYQAGKYDIETGGNGYIGLGSWMPQSDTLHIPPTFESGSITPITVQIRPETDESPFVEYIAYGQNWEGDNIDNTGDGTIDGGDENWTYTLHMAARSGNMTRTAEAILRGFDVNVWRNAIFAGTGQAGGLINGNVSVHGSVHLLGDNIVEGGAAIAAIDLSGTSLIHNNYSGMPADLRIRVPDLTQVDENGEMSDTLEAALRVKNGLAGLSGNSEVGSAQISGNAAKDWMDGTFVNDGWTGNAVVDDGDRGDPIGHVFSDNGWDELYDLGDRVPFPVLTDDWREPVTGAKVMDPDTGVWYTHEDYFNEVLLADPADQADGWYNGDIDLYTQGDHFYWNATTGEELSGALPAAAPSASDDYILFDADSDTLEVNGQITVNGALTVRGKSNQMSVHYSGRAAILAYGDVTLDCNLLACNNGDPSDIVQSFPVNNILGIMTAQDMMVGSVAQISLMGAFYAQGRISSAKQTNVAGTFVASYFDMGTNVPAIFQVPVLADNLPFGMIGNYPILTLSRVAWRELGVTVEPAAAPSS